MKIISKKYIAIIFILSTVLASHSLAQHQHDSDSTKTKNKKMNCCMKNHDAKSEMMNKDKNDSYQPIVLEDVDKNKDGKVYQDQMDWNVISDKPGKCSLCKMALKEVTIKEAKENLIKNGFKVK